MASVNKTFDAIEDEIVRALETGIELPPNFTITISPEAMVALLTKPGLKSTTTGQQLPNTLTRVVIMIAGHKVIIRSEKDPEPWATVAN